MGLRVSYPTPRPGETSPVFPDSWRDCNAQCSTQLPPVQSDAEWFDRLVAAYRADHRHSVNGKVPSVAAARRTVLNLQVHGLLPWSAPAGTARELKGGAL